MMQKRAFLLSHGECADRANAFFNIRSSRLGIPSEGYALYLQKIGVNRALLRIFDWNHPLFRT
jgi:hypothetical protein